MTYRPYAARLGLIMKKKISNTTARIIADNAADLRYQKRWSQAKAAEAAGISVRTYIALELCETVPKLETVVSVARGYEVTVSELIGEVPRFGNVQSSLHELNEGVRTLNSYLKKFDSEAA